MLCFHTKLYCYCLFVCFSLFRHTAAPSSHGDTVCMRVVVDIFRLCIVYMEKNTMKIKKNKSCCFLLCTTFSICIKENSTVPDSVSFSIARQSYSIHRHKQPSSFTPNIHTCIKL